MLTNVLVWVPPDAESMYYMLMTRNGLSQFYRRTGPTSADSAF